tara:strand:+ start:398 stop:646 length:249 start_codon:yes stop_codon:yes gene_type:complete
MKTLDWYVKWVATMFVLISVMFRLAGVDYHFFDMICGLVGTVLWLWVAILWQDRALIILNVIMTILLGTGVIKIIVEAGVIV